MKFLLTRDYVVKAPKRIIGQNAGYDFFVPAFNDDFMVALTEKNSSVCVMQESDDCTDEKHKGCWYIRLAPHNSVNIPSGIHTLFADNEALIMQNKSGIAANKHLIVGACVIDSSYEGIVHLNVINTSDEYQKIYFDEKLVQGVLFFISNEETSSYLETDMPLEKFYEGHESERKSGGFGSTGAK